MISGLSSRLRDSRGNYHMENDFSKALALYIFRIGDEGIHKTWRMQYKSGTSLENETSHGGLCLDAMERVISSFILDNDYSVSHTETMPMVNRRCDTCQWWQRRDDPVDSGECRFNAPSSGEDPPYYWGIFPLTTKADWCSMHSEEIRSR